MDTINLVFEPISISDNTCDLFFVIERNNKMRRVRTGYRIGIDKWDLINNQFISGVRSSINTQDNDILIRDILFEKKRFYTLANHCSANRYSIDELVQMFQVNMADGQSVFGYLKAQIHKMRTLLRIRCSETMRATLNSFMRFRNGRDLGWSDITSDMMELYQAYIKNQGLTRNTSSFYMRNLKTVYLKAVCDGIIVDKKTFRNVYTGIDKTVKRAISLDCIMKLKTVDLSDSPVLEFVRDITMFSFYARGMSFVDMAFLSKDDIENDHIIYRRRKTGQTIMIQIEPEMLQIITKYTSHTRFLLPIILKEGPDERQQYKNQLIRINRYLKSIGKRAGIATKLSTYVMRHSWATIARDKNIPLGIISEGLGHDNEATTRIYLDSIRSSKVDRANRTILNELLQCHSAN